MLHAAGGSPTGVIARFPKPTFAALGGGGGGVVSVAVGSGVGLSLGVGLGVGHFLSLPEPALPSRHRSLPSFGPSVRVGAGAGLVAPKGAPAKNEAAATLMKRPTAKEATVRRDLTR